MNKPIIIDAKGAVLGRLASYIAKQALLGKSIAVVNCSKAIVAGIRSNVVREYIIARQRGGSSLNGPHFPKDPSMLVKRTIRGMIKYKKANGLRAFKNIMCYNDIPKEYESSPKILAGRQPNTKSMTLEELNKLI